MSDHRALIKEAKAAVEACQPNMRARDHIQINTLLGHREEVFRALADDVPGLVALVARLAAALEQAGSIEVTHWTCNAMVEDLRAEVERWADIAAQNQALLTRALDKLADAERRVAESQEREDRWRMAVTYGPCKCDPPGSGEELCSGGCYLREERDRALEQRDQAERERDGALALAKSVLNIFTFDSQDRAVLMHPHYEGMLQQDRRRYRELRDSVAALAAERGE